MSLHNTDFFFHTAFFSLGYWSPASPLQDLSPPSVCYLLFITFQLLLPSHCKTCLHTIIFLFSNVWKRACPAATSGHGCWESRLHIFAPRTYLVLSLWWNGSLHLKWLHTFCFGLFGVFLYEKKIGFNRILWLTRIKYYISSKRPVTKQLLFSGTFYNLHVSFKNLTLTSYFICEIMYLSTTSCKICKPILSIFSFMWRQIGWKMNLIYCPQCLKQFGRNNLFFSNLMYEMKGDFEKCSAYKWKQQFFCFSFNVDWRDS